MRHRVRVDVDRRGRAPLSRNVRTASRTASSSVPLGGSSCIETTNSPRASRVATATSWRRGLRGVLRGERRNGRRGRERAGRAPASDAFERPAPWRGCARASVPQQPPIRRAPRRAASRANQAKYSESRFGIDEAARRRRRARPCSARRRGEPSGPRTPSPPGSRQQVARPERAVGADDVGAEALESAGDLAAASRCLPCPPRRRRETSPTRRSGRDDTPRTASRPSGSPAARRTSRA